MPWLNLHCLLDAAGADALAEALMDVGALSTSIEDADAGTPAETRFSTTEASWRVPGRGC